MLLGKGEVPQQEFLNGGGLPLEVDADYFW
jgi:hypothetical protein